MSGRGVHGWLGVVVAAAVMVTGAALGAHAAPLSTDANPVSDPHLAAALRQAEGMLGTFVAPPGSHKFSGLPDPPPPYLAGPADQQDSFAQAIAWYSTGGSPDDVLAWVTTHPPVGSTTDGGVGHDSNGLMSESFIYSKRYTSLDVTPEVGSDGRTLIRVLAMVPWTPARRSPDSLVPAGAAKVMVTTLVADVGVDLDPAYPRIPLPADETATLSSTDPHVVERIRALVNALQPESVDDMFYCDKPGDSTRAEIDFVPGTRVDVDPLACGDVSIVIASDGRVLGGAALGGGAGLVSEVYSLFGIAWRRS